MSKKSLDKFQKLSVFQHKLLLDNEDIENISNEMFYIQIEDINIWNILYFHDNTKVLQKLLKKVESDMKMSDNEFIQFSLNLLIEYCLRDEKLFFLSRILEHGNKILKLHDDNIYETRIMQSACRKSSVHGFKICYTKREKYYDNLLKKYKRGTTKIVFIELWLLIMIQHNNHLLLKEIIENFPLFKSLLSLKPEIFSILIKKSIEVNRSNIFCYLMKKIIDNLELYNSFDFSMIGCFMIEKYTETKLNDSKVPLDMLQGFTESLSKYTPQPMFIPQKNIFGDCNAEYCPHVIHLWNNCTCHAGKCSICPFSNLLNNQKSIVNYYRFILSLPSEDSLKKNMIEFCQFDDFFEHVMSNSIYTLQYLHPFTYDEKINHHGGKGWKDNHLKWSYYYVLLRMRQYQIMSDEIILRSLENLKIDFENFEKFSESFSKFSTCSIQ